MDAREARRRGAKLVRRFTGGGTIACDGDTLFVGMTMNAGDDAMVRRARDAPAKSDGGDGSGVRAGVR